jgi:hypothetical protein
MFTHDDPALFDLAAQTLAMVPGARTQELSELLARLSQRPDDQTAVQVIAALPVVLAQLHRETSPEVWLDQVPSFAIGEDMIAVLVAERSSQIALLTEVNSRLQSTTDSMVPQAG